MNHQHQTLNIERLARTENRSDFFFPSCLVGYALPAVMALLFLFLPVGALSEPGNAKTNLHTLSPDESRKILDQLGNMRQDIRTLQADFIEQRFIPSLAIPLKYEGKIYYQNNGLFFMEYTKPIHHILRVLDNKALFFVEGGKTADLVDVSAGNGIAGNPNIFALNPDNFSGQILESNDTYILTDGKKQMTPKGPGPKLTVTLKKDGLQIKEVRIADESGDITEIYFFNVMTNLDIPKSILSFKLPEGMKVNQLNQP